MRCVTQIPYGAPEHRKPRVVRPQGRARDRARRPPGQGCPVGRPPCPRREAQGEVAPSGACFLWFLSLHEQRKKPRVQGRSHPQLAFQSQKPPVRRLLIIHTLDPRFRGDDNLQGVHPSTSSGRTAEGRRDYLGKLNTSAVTRSFPPPCPPVLRLVLAESLR